MGVVGHVAKVGTCRHVAFAVDVLRCAHCGSRRELLAVVMKADAVAAILTHLGLDTDDAGPRPPPSQLDLI